MSNSPTALAEGLSVRSLNEVEEPIDPRISIDSRPDDSELDLGVARQLTDLVHHHHGEPKHHEESTVNSEKTLEAETFYVSLASGSKLRDFKLTQIVQVEFAKGDQRDPANFSRRKKWTITIAASFLTLLACLSIHWPWRIMLLTVAILSNRCFVLRYGISIHDPRSELHRFPSHHRSQRLRPWIWCRPPRFGFPQRGVWKTASVYRLLHWISSDARNGSLVRAISALRCWEIYVREKQIQEYPDSHRRPVFGWCIRLDRGDYGWRNYS
jgi:hypothetical protein